LFTAQS